MSLTALRMIPLCSTVTEFRNLLLMENLLQNLVHMVQGQENWIIHPVWLWMLTAISMWQIRVTTELKNSVHRAAFWEISVSSDPDPDSS